MDYTRVRTACIIGAGVAGLATARALSDAGATCTVFEQNDRLGGVWTDGYVGFGVQVQKELYEFPEFPLPDDVPQFAPGPVIQRYLEDYVDHFDLRHLLRLATPIERVEPSHEHGQGQGQEWVVAYRDGDRTRQERFDLVVICVGLYSNLAFVPEIVGQADFAGQIMRTGDVRSVDLFKGRNVTVVGFGKSGTDVATTARDHAKQVSMIARRLHWPVPRKLAGLLPFKWGLLNRLTVTMIPPYKTRSGLERFIHGPGKPLAWLFWRSVETLLRFQFKLGSRFGTRQSLVPSEKVEVGAFSEATMLPRPDFFRSVRKGEITLHIGEIARFTRDGIALLDGTNVVTDIVVFCTGWRSDYGFLCDDLRRRLGFAEDGIYLYRQMLHPALPGLAFVGYASTVSNILAYRVQAHWLAELIKGAHQLPDDDAMLHEIETLRDWKRSWMPSGHARAARLIVHLQHYLDELLTDIGVEPKRKTGVWAPLKEVVEPYQPKDYRDLFCGQSIKSD